MEYKKYCEYCVLMGEPVYSHDYEQWMHPYDTSMTKQGYMPCKADRFRKKEQDKLISEITLYSQELGKG